jgi:hypothetical protein
MMRVDSGEEEEEALEALEASYKCCGIKEERRVY